MPKILMVSAEAGPFATTGGLGDVLHSLPKALASSGETVAVVLPLYGNVVLRDPQVVYERLQFSIGNQRYTANILQQVAYRVRYLFVDVPELYERPEIYGDHPDTARRFAGLSHAALGVARHVFVPDIIHCHDWASAMLPLLVREVYRKHPAYLGIKTIFTIHNLAYQGKFPLRAAALLGLPERLLGPDTLLFDGQLNFIKCGLLTSDHITTVSPTYGQEIQTPAYGFGMDSILRARSRDLTGILNGADYHVWDPATDPHIAKPFTHRDLSGKHACKKQLLEEIGLPAKRLDKPLVAIIGRFVWQKGLDLLASISNELAAEDVSYVVMGNGEPSLEDFFRWFATTNLERISVRFGYDDTLAHRIHAGADLLLMPSRYEPCGLTQLYAMRYGTLPLVRSTGGLSDTVDANTGFSFRNDTPAALLECLRQALRVYGTSRWTEMMQNAMQQDFSWTSSARKYANLYRHIHS